MGKKSRRNRPGKAAARPAKHTSEDTTIPAAGNPPVVAAPAPAVEPLVPAAAPPPPAAQENSTTSNQLVAQSHRRPPYLPLSSRDLATFLIANYLSLCSSDTYPRSDKWDKERILMLECYCCVMIEMLEQDSLIFEKVKHKFLIPKKDRLFLRSIYKDPEELSYARALAAAAWEAMSFASLEFVDSTISNHTVIKLYNEASELEKATFGAGIAAIAPGFQGLKELATEKLKSRGLMLLEPTVLTCHGAEAEFPFFAGDSCDACGKRIQTYGETTFLQCCGRCQQTHYCSKECQQAHWTRGGHKESCRKRGEIKVGDARNYVAPGDELMHVVILAPVFDHTNKKKPHKWLVFCRTHARRIILAKYLKRTRTQGLKWYSPNTANWRTRCIQSKELMDSLKGL